MWIMSQNKECLVELKKRIDILTNKDYVQIVCQSTIIGTYKTEERCVELIKDINKARQTQKRFNQMGLVFADSSMIDYSAFEMPGE